ncbi:MAG: hypothetical protein QM784_13960 [Polyangiaceae bacterium]
MKATPLPRTTRPSRRSFRRRLATFGLGLALTCVASSAAAIEKRRLPDYDGRGGEPTRPGDAALWVPRVALFPFYIVSEYVIRRPLGALVSGAERAGVPQTVYEFFMLTDDHAVGWVPTFFVDFGFKPSAGAYFFWNDAFVERNRFTLHAATWGTNWLMASVADSYAVDERRSVTFRGLALSRPDFRYYSPGPESREEQMGRFGALRLESELAFRQRFGSLSSLEVAAGVRHLRFRNPSDDYVSVRERVREGWFELPEAYEDGYTAGFQRAHLSLDSRRARPSSQTGARIELDGEQGNAPGATPRSWMRYGAIAGGFLDLNDRARVLSLSLATTFSDPMTSAGVPFTELVQLGGAELMPGFVPGRLRGRSALVSTLGYHWPVWVWLDGTIQFSVGNVYGPHLDGLKASALRMAGAIGVQTSVTSENPVEILLGFGTETFDQGARLNTLRLAIGTTRGF